MLVVVVRALFGEGVSMVHVVFDNPDRGTAARVARQCPTAHQTPSLRVVPALVVGVVGMLTFS